jgi:hypothetical protein
MYNANQAAFIDLLIGPGMTANTPPSSFQDTVADIEDNIGISDLTVNEQTPLFLATILGMKASIYWNAQINDELQPYWVSKLSPNAGANYMNTLQWSTAAMNGALCGYGASATGLVEPTTAMVTNRLLSALIGALTATAGKLLFNWTPRMVKPLSLNMSRIEGLNNNGGVNGNLGNKLPKTADTGFLCTYGTLDGCGPNPSPAPVPKTFSIGICIPSYHFC